MRIIIKKNIHNAILLGIIFAYFVHPFAIKGMGVIYYFIVYGIPAIYLATHFQLTNKLLSLFFTKKGEKYVVGLLLLTIWSLIVLIFNNSSDTGFIWTIMGVFRGLLRYLFLLELLMLSNNNDEERDLDFIHYYVLANVIYVCCTIILVANPALKEFWFSIIEQSTLSLTDILIYSNRVGINGFAGYRETATCTLAVIFCLYLIVSRQEKKSLYILFLFICLIGNFFYGRVGLVASMLCVIIFIILYHKIDMVYVLTGIIMVLFLFALSRYLISVNDSFRTTIDWATRPIIELISTGNTTNYSFNNMLNGLFMPEPKTLAIGDGYYRDPNTGGYYMQTDLGFMRMTLFGGVLACVIAYSMIALGIFEKWANYPAVSLFLFIMFVLFEFKGDIWYSLLPVLMIISIIRALMMMKENKRT